MGLLGDMLEVLYGPAVQPDSIRATIRRWRNPDLAERADGGGRTVMGRRKLRAQDSTPRIEEVVLSIWVSPPARVRIEERRQVEGGIEESLLVADGDRWWSCGPDGRVVTGGAAGPRERGRAPGLINLERHFDHATLRKFFECLALEPLGEVRVAGRDCLRLRASPRPGSLLWPHWLPHGADEYELHADPRRAVLLTIIGRHQGEVFEGAEVTEMAFGEQFEDALFVCSPPASAPVRAAAPVAERLTLDAAVRRLPFTVLLPTNLPDADHSPPEVIFHPPRGCSPRAYLSLMYRGDTSCRLWLNEAAQADPDLEQYEWERVERGGQELLISDPGAGVGLRLIALERQGTHVTIRSDLERERLLDLAASLAPAPTART